MKDELTLFDRIFKPKQYVLPNGKIVDEKKSRVPFIVLCVLIVVVICIKVTDFDLSIVISRIDQLNKILGKIFKPDFTFFPKVVEPLLDTLKMSLAGTAVGCILALPFAVLSSSNINKNKFSLWLIRVVLGIIRTIPTLIMATVFALVFGLGTFAGTVAIVVFTFGIVAKMLFESIETIDLGPYEALLSLGCNKFQAFWTACVPQILPTYLSHCLYCFEMNVRAASILGYVGAGGLGIQINERIGWRDYNGLGTVLLTLFITVLIIENTSEYFRKKLS